MLNCLKKKKSKLKMITQNRINKASNFSVAKERKKATKFFVRLKRVHNKE